MIRTSQITPTQIALSHNGSPVGEFRKMTPGVWVFMPNSTMVYTASVLRQITDRLSNIGIAGAAA